MPSSVVRDWRYDPVCRELRVVFRSGRIYAYAGVPAAVAAGLAAAASKGEYFKRVIRDRYSFREEPGDAAAEGLTGAALIAALRASLKK
jgi:hypothetical protein